MFEAKVAEMRKIPTLLQMTLTCQASEIDRDELYSCIHGTCPTNEAESLNRRHLEFNLDELCSLASRTKSSSRVKEFEKMEICFNKVLS